jgi:hypothetical protein
MKSGMKGQGKYSHEKFPSTPLTAEGFGPARSLPVEKL